MLHARRRARLYWSAMDPPHKGSIKQKTFPRHDVFIPYRHAQPKCAIIESSWWKVYCHFVCIKTSVQDLRPSRTTKHMWRLVTFTRTFTMNASSCVFKLWPWSMIPYTHEFSEKEAHCQISSLCFDNSYLSKTENCLTELESNEAQSHTYESVYRSSRCIWNTVSPVYISHAQEPLGNSQK